MSIDQDKIRIDLPPGSVVVVGPRGRLTIEMDRATGRGRIQALGCDFATPGQYGAPQQALVEHVWETRSEFGYPLRHGEPVCVVLSRELADMLAGEKARLGREIEAANAARIAAEQRLPRQVRDDLRAERRRPWWRWWPW